MRRVGGVLQHLRQSSASSYSSPYQRKQQGEGEGGDTSADHRADDHPTVAVASLVLRVLGEFFVYFVLFDTFFYWGHRLMHWRPGRMKGRHYCSLFVHYRPREWALTDAAIAEHLPEDWARGTTDDPDAIERDSELIRGGLGALSPDEAEAGAAAGGGGGPQHDPAAL